ncbi:SGNH/GDSL hydrolase family protein [Pseudalkalibacillus sp. SCS-8]|uniref:SGNH/GDSL hydrolase family protein n=1 Tax=Pseudalkalibacillus nanhaiensis TaxID=3115291 RepID=UPI0032DB3EF5
MPTLVCFGDSLTAMEESIDGSERLTPRLRHHFSEWTIVNSGVPGETTRAALARLQDDVLRHAPDLVTILFGSNDASEHRRIEIMEFERNLEIMIDRISPQKTILISPPPIREAAQDKRSNVELEHYVEVTRKIAAKRGCYFIDLWEHFSHNDRYEDLLIQDGLHFNEQAYFVFSELIIEEIKSIHAKAV